MLKFMEGMIRPDACLALEVTRATNLPFESSSMPPLCPRYTAAVLCSKEGRPRCIATRETIPAHIVGDILGDAEGENNA